MDASINGDKSVTKQNDDGHRGPSRRTILKGLAVLGAGSVTFRGCARRSNGDRQRKICKPWTRRSPSIEKAEWPGGRGFRLASNNGTRALPSPLPPPRRPPFRSA